MNRKIYRSLLTVCLAWVTGLAPVYGQEVMRFSNKRLESMVSALNKADTKKDVDRLVKQVYVDKDRNGTVNAAGIRMFDKEMLKGMDAQSRIMCEFVERYLLELLLTRMPGTCMKLQEDRVKIFPDADKDDVQRNLIVKALNECDENTGMKIENVKSKGKVSICNSKGKTLLELEFPMGHELLTGMTKLEAESSLYDNLMDFCASTGNSGNGDGNEKNLQKYKGNIVKTADNKLENMEMFGMKYFKQNNRKLVPLYDGRFPVESVFTLMNGAYNGTDVIASVTVNMYGYQKKVFEIPVKYLTQFFIYNGCELYTGIRKLDSGVIAGAMVACNRIMNYNHIVEFEMSRNIFYNKKNNKLKVTMYGYIPLHNVNLL